jgi:hypothetical protein
VAGSEGVTQCIEGVLNAQLASRRAGEPNICAPGWSATNQRKVHSWSKPGRTGSATSRAARMAMTAMMGECALARRRQGR